MKFTEITVSTTTEASEIVAYFLQEVSTEGVSIFDAKDLNIPTWDYVDESLKSPQTSEVLVKGYCKTEDTDGVLYFLNQQLKNLDKSTCGSLKITLQEVSDDSWVAIWKQTFKAIEIGNFVICPEWITPPKPKTGQKLLKLETGVAFGTGQHQTTAGVLEFLSKIPLNGKTIVDIGCGSGILALCALLAGAQHATLIDNDPQATEISAYNASINNLSHLCEIKTCNLADDLTQKFDIVLANLTAEILQILAADILEIVKKGTILVLSGILTDRVEKIKQCYTKLGFCLVDQIIDGEWCTLLMQI